MQAPWITVGNKVYLGVLSFQFFLSIAIGFFTDNLLLGLVASVLILALPLILLIRFPHSAVTPYVAVMATQLLTALHIHETMGLTYMHFEIFAVMAVSSVYRDWKVVVSGVAVVAVHHFLFYYLQTQSVGVFAFEPQYLMLHVLAVHAFFAIAEGAILCFVAKQLNTEGNAALELENAIHKIIDNKDCLDLNVKTSKKTSTLEDFELLMDTFSGFIKQTQSVAENLFHVSDEVVSLSNGVQQASIDTSGRVSTIASATEEMTVNNSGVADRASRVSELSSEANSASHDAKRSVDDANQEVLALRDELVSTSDTINELSEKCQQIESVMTAISAISEQTNLLALNAAIESARAGEHGRGFAVVADEVRQLAMKTQQNASHIGEITQSLISDSQTSVARMQSCVDKSIKVAESSTATSDMIDKVANSISEVSGTISSVSEAIREQSQASGEISQSTHLLADTSEQLSNNAIQSQSSAEKLTNDVNKLKSELSKFA